VLNLRKLAAPAAAVLVVTLLAGGYLSGREHGRAACALGWQQREIDLAAQWRAEVERQQAVADDLSRRLAATETRTRTVYKEIVREIPAATLGRPCLGPDALGLLGRLPGLAPTGGLPAPASEPADPAATLAPAAAASGDVTDTQIAGWIADAWEQHERERERCNALIEWHQ